MTETETAAGGPAPPARRRWVMLAVSMAAQGASSVYARLSAGFALTAVLPAVAVPLVPVAQESSDGGRSRGGVKVAAG